MQITDFCPFSIWLSKAALHLDRSLDGPPNDPLFNRTSQDVKMGVGNNQPRFFGELIVKPHIGGMFWVCLGSMSLP